MLKFFRLAFIVLGLLGNVFALEFGSMGQVSAGMGGAGVALKDSAWGLYYNPALLGADRRTKLGYSFGASFKEQNLLQIATLDKNELTNLPATLENQLTGFSSGGSSVSIGGMKVDGALGGTLQALFGKDSIDVADVQNLVTEVNGAAATCVDIATCWQQITDAAALEKFRDKLVGAATEGGSPLVGAIIGGITNDKLTELAKDALSGNVDIDQMLQDVGSLTLSKGADSTIDKLLDSFSVISKALDSNDVNVVTQNGLVFQFAGDKKTRRIESDTVGSIDIQEVDSGRGAVGVGLFASAFSNASVGIDPNNSRLIFDLGGKYYEVRDNGNGITLSYLATQNNLDGSVMNENANHTLYANALAIFEVPVGYGHTFFTPLGDVNLGLAAKFMQVMSYGNNLNFSIGKMPSFSFSYKNDVDSVQTFGIDAGLLYTPRFLKNLNVGLVVKNINAPTIQSRNLGNITLNRQVRAGVSYTMRDFLTFAFDADIVPNDTLSLSSPKSQFFGGGVMANFKVVDFRLGAMRDIRSQAGEGYILTGGINLFGFLDVAMQYGLGQNVTIQGFNISNYMNLRIGGQFTF